MLTVAGTASCYPIITTLLKAVSLTALGFAFMPKQEIEALSFDSDQQEKFNAAILYSRILASPEINLVKMRRSTPFLTSKLKFTKLVGIEFVDQVYTTKNSFKNNILISAVAFHQLKALNNILDNCDFKSDKQLTNDILSYRDRSGLNLLNHVCGNRGTIGDNLSNKIIDIYVENLDKKTLLESLDKFVLTLPPEQFKKIADKVGIENLQKIGTNITKQDIKRKISTYHSPNIFLKKNGKGYEQNTLMNKIESHPLALKTMIEMGYGVQITPEIASKFDQIEFAITGKPGVYTTTGDTFSGKLPDIYTYKALSYANKKEMLKYYEPKTVLSNFLENSKANKKYLAQQKNSFSATRMEAGKPSPAPSSPQVSSEKPGKEL